MKLLILVNLIGGDTHAARREFLSYCLSLMRAHNSEHLDSLPVLDVSALKHVAYVFDALIYFMRSGDGTNMDNNEYRREGLSVPSQWHDPVSYSFFCLKKKFVPTDCANLVLFDLLFWVLCDNINLFFRTRTRTKKPKKISP